MLCFALMTLALAGAASADSAPRPYLPPRGYGAPSYKSCEAGLVRRADGACVKPVVVKNLFLYNSPAPRVTYLPPRYIPDPRVNVNYVFVRTSGAVVDPKPLVAAPPKQKTLVYLLNKNLEPVEREVIQVEAENEEPDVYFVNYNEGENPELPGGIDLKTALRQTQSEADVIEVASAENGASEGYKYEAPAKPLGYNKN